MHTVDPQTAPARLTHTIEAHRHIGLLKLVAALPNMEDTEETRGIPRLPTMELTSLPGLTQWKSETSGNDGKRTRDRISRAASPLIDHQRLPGYRDRHRRYDRPIGHRHALHDQRGTGRRQDAISVHGISTPHAGMRAMEERNADVKGEKRTVSSRRIKLRTIQSGALEDWY